MASAWIGPVIIAAFIAGTINVLGWFITARNRRRLDQERRLEKMLDFQYALRAEILCEKSHLILYDYETHFSEIKDRYNRIENYSVTVPHPTRQVVFEALLPEIHVLPSEVIQHVVMFTRQMQVVASICDDMRAESFRKMTTEQQLEMYRDYLHLREYAANLAENAVAALDASLPQMEN